MSDYKRRAFIKLTALGFATIAFQLDSIGAFALEANANQGKRNEKTKLNWDAFLEQLSALSKCQYDKKWNQKKYTNKVMRLLKQCNFPEFENVKKELESYENRNPNWFESSSLHYEFDFQVSLFQFEKGEYIPHHDHPEMTGVLNVVSGSILTKNYTIEEKFETSREVIRQDESIAVGKCILRETGNEIIQTGQVGILTAQEGNIHSLMPNEFSQMVDVFTPSYKHDTNANWYAVNEDEIYQGQDKMYLAEYSTVNLNE